MNTEEYKDKLDQILADTTKFKTIERDPTKELKVEFNKIIKSINRDCGRTILEPLIVEFAPGYLCGTVKNLKIGNPPETHNLPNTHAYPHVSEATKQNNYPLYLPTKFMLSSTDDFLSILRNTNHDGLI